LLPSGLAARLSQIVAAPLFQRNGRLLLTSIWRLLRAQFTNPTGALSVYPVAPSATKLPGRMKYQRPSSCSAALDCRLMVAARAVGAAARARAMRDAMASRRRAVVMRAC